MHRFRHIAALTFALLLLSACLCSCGNAKAAVAGKDGGYNIPDIRTTVFDQAEATSARGCAIDTSNAAAGYICVQATSASPLKFQVLCNGNSYNYSRSRSASFTCRIPSAKLDAFLSAVDGIGNVTYSYEDQKDVTLNYVDTEARIASLQTEYDRLLELLAQAESVDTIIMLEQRLSDVRYQLESYKSQLRTYDNLVDYSTVEISVDEVQRVSSPEEEGVFARIQSGFSDSLYSVGTGLVDFFVWFVANIPYFAVIAVIALIIVLIVMACLKNSPRHKAKVARKKAEKERRKAERLAKKNGVLPTEAPVPEKPENSENKGE